MSKEIQIPVQYIHTENFTMSVEAKLLFKSDTELLNIYQQEVLFWILYKILETYIPTLLDIWDNYIFTLALYW